MNNERSKGEDVDQECCSNSTNLPTEMTEILCSNGGLDRVKRQTPDKVELSSKVKLFKALSDPIRLQILSALSASDLCPCILKEITELSDSKLSYHLNILEDAHLISYSPRSKWRIYSLTSSGKEILAALDQIFER
jgi:DNA-binding transcriptional ArsR family regulator